MMLKYSFGLAEESDAIEAAVNRVLEKRPAHGRHDERGLHACGLQGHGRRHLRGNLSAHEQSMPVWRILFFSPACFWGKYKELGDRDPGRCVIWRRAGVPRFYWAARRCTACLFPFCPPCRAGRRQSQPSFISQRRPASYSSKLLVALHHCKQVRVFIIRAQAPGDAFPRIARLCQMRLAFEPGRNSCRTMWESGTRYPSRTYSPYIRP